MGDEREIFSTEIKKTKGLMENFRFAIGLRIKGELGEWERKERSSPQRSRRLRS
jgi:DNA helicase TIP49 (TBP-interacting protein)